LGNERRQVLKHDLVLVVLWQTAIDLGRAW
jgi:hypothetical protein